MYTIKVINNGKIAFFFITAVNGHILCDVVYKEMDECQIVNLIVMQRNGFCNYRFKAAFCYFVNSSLYFNIFAANIQCRTAKSFDYFKHTFCTKVHYCLLFGKICD